MHDESATLLLTRPRARSEEFLSLCEASAGHRLPSVISPVIEIADVGELPDLSGYDTIILTSANAVRRLGPAGLLRGRSVATVGTHTAELATVFGADARSLGDDVESFLASKPAFAGPAIHCHGVHARGALAARLLALGQACDEAVVYDQVAQPLNAAARALLDGTSRVVLPLFSPRSAKLVSASGPPIAPVTAIAMSQAVADAWQFGGDVRIAYEPRSDAMRDAVLSAL